MLGIDWLDPNHILTSSGGWALWLTAAIVVAECGLLFGFFLPGDTLLFSVGVLTATGVVDHSPLFACTVLALAALLGNVIGYELGRAVGPRLLHSPRQRLVRQDHVREAEAFFDRHGPLAIGLARFVPVVRTLITVVAGAAGMDRRRYFLWSTVGAIVWVFSITLVGYFLGQTAFVQDYVEPHLDLIILAAVAVSVGPILVRWLLSRRRSGGDDATPVAGTTTDPGA